MSKWKWVEVTEGLGVRQWGKGMSVEHPEAIKWVKKRKRLGGCINLEVPTDALKVPYTKGTLHLVTIVI